MTRPPLYGLDLLTAGSASATDPSATASSSSQAADAHIVAVGLSLEGCERRFVGDEARLLLDLDAFLAELPPGVLTTWHGSVTDLPVLAARAAAVGVPTGLRLRPDARVGLVATGSRKPTTPMWCGAWHDHRHLDLARVYAPAASRGFRFRRGGVPEDLIPPSDERTGHDPRHDAHLTRCLAERRWDRARRLVDRMPPVPGAGPRLPGSPASRPSAWSSA